MYLESHTILSTSQVHVCMCVYFFKYHFNCLNFFHFCYYILDLKNIINNQSNDSMDFLSTTPTVASISNALSAPLMNPIANNMNPLNTLPPPLVQQQSSLIENSIVGDLNATNSQMANAKPLEGLVIYENYDVHETHRIEDGIFTQMARLPPKKQELLKQFGIQTNQTVTYYEKYIIIENFNRFCNVSK